MKKNELILFGFLCFTTTGVLAEDAGGEEQTCQNDDAEVGHGFPHLVRLVRL